MVKPWMKRMVQMMRMEDKNRGSRGDEHSGGIDGEKLLLPDPDAK